MKRENDHFVFISRIIGAPRELVFQAWTDPEHLKRWFAPRGCTIHFSAIDVREGGEFLSCIKNPRFKDCWCKGTYLEIIPPEKIVYNLAVSDEQGNLITPEEAGMDPEWPGETTVTVTFTELQGKTKLTLHQTVSETVAKRTGAHPSWIQMLDILEEHLAHKTAGSMH